METPDSPNDARQMPLDAVSGEPLLPRKQPGYYPGFNTLEQQSFWDEATRKVIAARVRHTPSIRFLDPEEAGLLATVCEHLLPQSDRVAERRVPILPLIDERLFLKRTPGYRFEEMPPDGEAYRLGLRAVQQMARQSFGRPFLELSWLDQERLLKSIHDAQPLPGAEELWRTLPIHRFWALLVQDCIDVYYAHPYAWDEIGFGGPAYPRAYTRLERGEPEPWEVEERRYAWIAPRDCLSDDAANGIASHKDHPVAGQGGTH